MKKRILSVAAMAMLAMTPISAELVSFEYDFMPTTFGTSTGVKANSQSFTLGFKIDKNLRAGIMQESMDLTLTNGAASSTGNVQISALNLEFTALDGFGANLKMPTLIGMNLGSANLNAPIVSGAKTIGASTEMLTDLYVKTEYAAGDHSYVSAKLGYRMLPLAETGGSFDNVNGMILKVGVGIRF